MSLVGLSHVLFLVLFDTLSLLMSRRREGGEQTKRQKVLIIRLDAIGDFVLWLDSARAICKRYPREQYELVLLSNVLWSPLAEDTGLFDEVWPLEKNRFVRNLRYRMTLLMKLRHACFDQVIHPTFSRETCHGDSLVRASGAPIRIGSLGDCSNSSSSSKMFSDHWYTKLLPAGQSDMMELQRHAEFVHGLGCLEFKPSAPFLELQYDFPEGFCYENYYIVVPGAGAQYRQWPQENFARIAREVHELTGLKAVICGNQSETRLAESLCRLQPDIFHDWAGKTSLQELVAIIHGAKFVLSNETSAVHIAAALKVPSVCILGGGHFGRFLPYPLGDEEEGFAPVPVYEQMDCYNCNWDCVYTFVDGCPAPCVERVKVAAVWDAIEQLLSQQK